MQRKTILWVEDEEEQSSVLVKVFSESGYDTIVRDNAKDALQVLKDVTPDLFLIDIKLKGDDGVELFKAIKKSDHLKNIPVVFLTAYNSLEMAVNAKKQGATDYITKPFEVDFLLDRIREIVPTG